MHELKESNLEFNLVNYSHQLHVVSSEFSQSFDTRLMTILGLTKFSTPLLATVEENNGPAIQHLLDTHKILMNSLFSFFFGVGVYLAIKETKKKFGN